MNQNFVHLHIHSHYSLIDGLGRITPLVDALAAMGMPAMAVTDVLSVQGLSEVFRATDAQGIHPILGAELLLPNAVDPGANRVLLLVENDRGYRNLNQWLSWSSRLLGWSTRWAPSPDAPGWPDADTEGLIALIGERSPIAGRRQREGDQVAGALLREWMKRFPGRLYLELTRTGRPGEEDWIRWCCAQAASLGIPLVASNAVRFLAADDFALYQARRSLAEETDLAELVRREALSPEQFLRSPAEMAKRFADLPEALANTLAIAERCQFERPMAPHPFPALGFTNGVVTGEWLATQAQRGLDHCLCADGIDAPERRVLYAERLREELEVIAARGFTECFAVLTDLVRWCVAQGIPVGPGRGRLPASLVAYALGITQVDPIAYSLPFAHFLIRTECNPPEICLDFGEGTRAAILDFLRERHGSERVAELTTIETLSIVQAIKRLSPSMHRPLTGDEARALLDREPNALDARERALLAAADRLAGVAVGVSAHGSNVLIAPCPLIAFAPLDPQGADGRPLSQLTSEGALALGLLPLDLAQYRPLSVIDRTVTRINARREVQGESPLDITRIPLDDPAVFGLFLPGRSLPERGWPTESAVRTALTDRIQPATFEHLVALRALWHPGPLNKNLDEVYAARRHGQVTPTYAHPRLEPILSPTYGLLLYVEQILRIALQLAGLNNEDAYILYREWLSPNPARKARQRGILIQALTRQGIDPASATAISDQVDQSISGAYPRAHAVAYTLIDYRCLWLFAHDPDSFSSAVDEIYPHFKD